MSVARFYHDDNEPSIFCLQAPVEVIHQANLYETGIGVRWVRRKFGTFRHDEMSGFAPASMLGGPAPLGACRKTKNSRAFNPVAASVAAMATHRQHHL